VKCILGRIKLLFGAASPLSSNKNHLSLKFLNPRQLSCCILVLVLLYAKSGYHIHTIHFNTCFG